MKLYHYFLLFTACNLVGCSYLAREDGAAYHQGAPVIMKKEYSLIPGVCTYTYEGYGKRETFEDKCNKYSVGDVLGGTSPRADTTSNMIGQ